ncbi:MAG: YHS domain protein [Chitinophagaceae bacterium]|nr:YHS domain protein [Chitinophagaceae bacterium]
MRFKSFLLVMMISLTSVKVWAQDSQKRIKEFNLDHGVAISGYDPVAYFRSGKAIKGKKSFIVNQGGVYYYFSSEENKEEFRKDPLKYEPEYGGWCAYAMGAKGEKVSIDPETFKIVNGKLYLFYNSFLNNTLKSWNKDEPNLKKKADASWEKIFH